MKGGEYEEKIILKNKLFKFRKDLFEKEKEKENGDVIIDQKNRDQTIDLINVPIMDVYDLYSRYVITNVQNTSHQEKMKMFLETCQNIFNEYQKREQENKDSTLILLHNIEVEKSFNEKFKQVFDSIQINELDKFAKNILEFTKMARDLDQTNERQSNV